MNRKITMQSFYVSHPLAEAGQSPPSGRLMFASLWLALCFRRFKPDES